MGQADSAALITGAPAVTCSARSRLTAKMPPALLDLEEQVRIVGEQVLPEISVLNQPSG